MKRLLLGIATAMLLAGPVMAADMPVKAMPPVVAVYNWTGIYLGVSGGDAYGHTDWVNFPLAPGLVVTPNPQKINDKATWGALGGIQKQWDRFVLGVEVNLYPEYLKTTSICPTGNICNAQVSKILTVGGRVGFSPRDFLNGRVLVYGTGGYATGLVETIVNNVGNGSFADASGTQNNGWYYGGGVEYALAPNILPGLDAILGAEYTRISFRTERGYTVPIINDDRNMRADVDIVKVRLSFKANWEAMAGAR